MFYGDVLDHIRKEKRPSIVGQIALVAVQQLLKQQLEKWESHTPQFNALDGNADNYIEIERFIDEKGGLEHIKQLDRNLYDLLEVHSVLLQYGS